MLAAVVPVRNEETHLSQVLDNLLALPVDPVLLVINGSSDGSRRVAENYVDQRINMLHYPQPLGIDMPRAIGALHASRLGADAVLFVDGDMKGNIRSTLANLILSIRGGCDLSLTDCYPNGAGNRDPVVQKILELRRQLNRALGIGYLGTASPSHGPHAVSRRFLEQIPLRELGVPPVTLVLAARKRLRIVIGASLPHLALGSPDRSPEHVRLITETIIGDYLEAFCVLEKRPRSRSREGITYNGYHPSRRWDLLEKESIKIK